MRILVTNPDSIGDFVLRQPMFAALTDPGHELMLVVRSLVAPLARWVAPKAEVAQFEGNPYEPGFGKNDFESLAPILKHIEEFEPDHVVVAPYQRTLLDEHITMRFPATKSIVMSGYLYPGDITLGLHATSGVQFTQTVPVSADDAELRKNEILCSAVLRKAVKLPPPALAPPDGVRQQARRRIHQLGLECGTFWVACVGHSRWTAVRNWTAEQWAEFLGALLDSYHLPLLFVGTADEHETTEDIRLKMGSAASGTVNLCAQPESLDLLVGLISESAGYIGRDTGPMHLAAAMDKPVIAIFGGGTWPRFVPAAKVGFAATVEVPCSGCQWICHLKDSHCIKLVPPTVAITEARQVLEKKRQFHTRTITPGRDLLSQWNSEAADAFRSRMRVGNGRLHQLELCNHELGALVEQHEPSLRAATMATDEQQTAREQKRDVEAQEVHLRAQQIQDFLARRERELEALNKEHQSTRDRLASTEESLDRRSREAATLRGQINELTRLVRQQEKSLLDRQFEFVAVTEERERLLKQVADFQALLQDCWKDHVALEKEADDLQTRLGDQASIASLQDQLQEMTLAHDNAMLMIESIRRSVFSKLLVKAGVWRVFQ